MYYNIICYMGGDVGPAKSATTFSERGARTSGGHGGGKTSRVFRDAQTMAAA